MGWSECMLKAKLRLNLVNNGKKKLTNKKNIMATSLPAEADQGNNSPGLKKTKSVTVTGLLCVQVWLNTRGT